jgi:hypothetical protein
MRTPSFVIITDIGPDPDDAKALLIAVLLHKQKQLRSKTALYKQIYTGIIFYKLII